jgi:Coenzyme PQQ synthesis protein D (PqqD)
MMMDPIHPAALAQQGAVRYNRTMAMDANMLITRTADLLESGVDDELFALDIDGGDCFGFNATAAEIWRRLATPMTLDALCDALMATRDVDRATCLADTAALIDRLVEDRLVALSPQ